MNFLALTNFVPAVAVKRRGRALFVLTGCKTYGDGLKSLNLNSLSNTTNLLNTFFLEYIGGLQNFKCRVEIR